MQTGREYIIQFVGLSVGEHVYKFNIDNKFFESIAYSEIKNGKINVELTLLKQSTMMILQFDITGSIHIPCDRCTVEFDLPIQGSYKLIVKIGTEEASEDDDIITLTEHEHQLDLAQYLYEYITLATPIKRVHPDNKKGQSTCDKEMLKKLSAYLVDDSKEEPTDPRWNDLKNIKLN